MSAPQPNAFVAAGAPAIGTSRLFVSGGDPDLRAHLGSYGAVDHRAIDAGMIDEVDRAGLTGRGGAAFPAARKLAAGRRSRDAAWVSSAVVVANGAEGEPRSLKDHTLLTNSPHLVIDGLLIAGRMVGASKLYLYTTASSMGTVERAVAQRSDARKIQLVEAVESFVSGEASAVVNAIETGIGLPRDSVVRLTTEGLKRKPTVVHNVETLAHVALIARFGAAWFRQEGSDDDPGTRLVTVSGRGVTERVLEVPGSTPVDHILRAAGADDRAMRAVLVGGYHGAWLPGDRLGTPLSRRSLEPFGAAPGAGILMALGRNECGLRSTAEIVRYLASQSAKQCGPCMFGLPELSSLLDQLVWTRPTPAMRARIVELSESLAGRGSCHHPDGTTRLVLDALKTFASDVDAHLNGRCQAEERR